MKSKDSEKEDHVMMPFIPRQLVEESIKVNKTAYLCFVDMKKEFVRIRLTRRHKNMQKKRRSEYNSDDHRR